MRGLWRTLFRPRSALGLGLIVVVLAAAQYNPLTRRSEPAPVTDQRILPTSTVDPRAEILARLATASPTPSPSPTREAPSPSPSPTESSPTPKPKPKPKPRGPSLSAFRGLGVWIDLWDYADLDIQPTIATVKRYGTRTLYLQTGRFNADAEVAPEVGPWLVAAHEAGLEVVGWYLPAYKHMNRDVRRSVAVARYRYRGHGFDAVGIDIEWKNDVSNPEWNDRVVRHLSRVRAELGRTIAVAAIVPPPLQMDVAPQRWAGFPWKGIAGNSHVIMLMSYWSYRDCKNVPEHCAYPFTRRNLERTRELIGKPQMPIHTIGGVGDRITREEVADFVRGARDGKAFGGSLYDYRTTAQDFWPLLARLRTL